MPEDKCTGTGKVAALESTTFSKEFYTTQLHAQSNHAPFATIFLLFWLIGVTFILLREVPPAIINHCHLSQ